MIGKVIDENCDMDDPWPCDPKQDWMHEATVFAPHDAAVNPNTGCVYQLPEGIEREWQMFEERNQQVIAKCALAGIRFEHRVLPQGFHRWEARMPDGALCCETNNINAAARHALAKLEEG